MKAFLRPLKYVLQSKYIEYCIYYRIWKQEITSVDFDFDVFKNDLLTFVASIKIKNSEFKHRYSRSCSIPVLYASMFACLTLGILGGLVDYSADMKRRWAEYFDSFQGEEDGLFYDPVTSYSSTRSSIFNNNLFC